jgi:hypothetical protein
VASLQVHSAHLHGETGVNCSIHWSGEPIAEPRFRVCGLKITVKNACFISVDFVYSVTFIVQEQGILNLPVIWARQPDTKSGVTVLLVLKL